MDLKNEPRFPVRLHTLESVWDTPDDIRSTIKSLNIEEGITGVVLVGALPMHHFLRLFVVFSGKSGE